MGSNSRRINFVGLTNTLLGLRIHFVVCNRHVQHLTLRSYPCPQGEETCNLHTPLTTHSKGQGSPAPAGNGGGCYASAPAAAPACSIAASCCGSVAVDAGAFRLRLRVCLATARFAEDILLTIKAGPASNASRRLVGTRTSFREVVDSARVASRLVKVSFREVVDSAPQASFHEVVESCLR